MPTPALAAKRSATFTLAVSSVMAAIVAVATFVIQIPVPQTGGYINVGDAAIFTAALVFGPVTGGFAGGVGSAISDLAGGYTAYAPITLVVKGLEGTLAGIVGNGRNSWRDIAGIAIGGAVMISGYFLAESFLLGVGVAAASVEVPGNLFQIILGGVIGIPLSAAVKRFVPSLRR